MVNSHWMFVLTKVGIFCILLSKKSNVSNQEFFYNLGNNRPPESIFPFIPLIIDLYKLLKAISDVLIEWRLLRSAGAIYSQLFCHFGCYNEAVFEGKSHDENNICYSLIGYQMLPLYVKKRFIWLPQRGKIVGCGSLVGRLCVRYNRFKLQHRIFQDPWRRWCQSNNR